MWGFRKVGEGVGLCWLVLFVFLKVLRPVDFNTRAQKTRQDRHGDLLTRGHVANARNEMCAQAGRGKRQKLRTLERKWLL